MKKTIIRILTMLIFSLPVCMQAQQRSISGTVFDVGGFSLPGASVVVKTTTTGVSTDIDGNFTISASNGDILVFSFLGYINQEIEINDQSTLKVVLNPDSKLLEETVIVGYGTVRKKDLTGSVVALSEKDFNDGPIVGVENLIQGRAAGIQVSTASAEPGGDVIVRIRGNNSVNSSNNPLYVVDGFPMESLDNSINPSDIASISILKDASATAIYGTRAANGVVLITTKRGGNGKATIEYSGSYSIQTADTEAYDFLDGNEYAEVRNAYDLLNGKVESYSEEAVQRMNELGINTNWLDEAFRTGTVQEHQVSVRGGNDETKVFFSAGAYLWDGVVKNTNYDRYTARLNADQKLWGDKLKIGINTSLSSTDSEFQGFSASSHQDNIMRSIFQSNPLNPTTEQYESLSDEDKALLFSSGPPSNPLQTLEIMDNNTTNYFVLTNAYLEAELFDGLTFKTSGGTRIVNRKTSQFLPSSSNLVASTVEAGQASIDHLLYKYYTFENFLTYSKVFDKHSINALLGTTNEWSSEEWFYAGAKDFTTDALGYYSLGSGATALMPASYIAESKLASYVSRLNYVYDDRYLFTFTFRRDGSSKFGDGNKWGNFPAGAVAWNVHNEEFFNVDVISNLKLRASVGVTGNERFGIGLGQSTFAASADVTTDGTNLAMGTVSKRVGNSNLQWEETRKIDVAAEIGMFDDKLNVELGAYKNNTTNLLLDKPLAASSGVESILTNAGEVQNSGIELGVNFAHRFDSGVRWTANYNFSKNSNEVIELILPEGSDYIPGSEARIDGSLYGSYSALKEGLPLSTIYGYRYLGVLNEGETSELQPTASAGDALFKDINGDGKITGEDKESIGNGYAKYNMSFNSSVSYSNFTLSALFTGVFDIDRFNANNVIGYQNNILESAKERWSPANTDGTLPQNIWQGDYWINDYFVEDASFIRLKSLSLTYDFSQRLLSRYGISKLQVSATGTNLITWDDYSGFDPEVSSSTSGSNLNTEAGFDAYSYPNQKGFTIGIKLGL